ncbi:MAG TPA: CoA transferase [Trebonia sp.]
MHPDQQDDAPLAGLRVIEVSSFVAAPLGGMTLAQLGAEVIRIDPPGGAPDTTRWPLAPNGASLYWAGLNKGKRSVTLDLRSAAGQHTVRQLIADSGPDGGIVLTNAGYPWLSYDALRGARPDLIHLQITGRHDGGTAVDYTVNAATGFPLATGDAVTSGPVNHVLPAWDIACGLYAAVGLLAAERHRRRTGKGRAITLPLADVALAVTGHLGFLAEGGLAEDGLPEDGLAEDGLAEGRLAAGGRPRIGNHLYGGFARDFRTGSGDSVMIVTLTARHYGELAGVTGRSPALAAVEQALGADFSRDSDRYTHREVIAALLAPWFAEHTTAEVSAALRGTSVLWERYRTFAGLAADPETRANPLVARINQPGIGAILATGIPLAQPGTPQTPVPAPVLGADTEAVLGEGWRASLSGGGSRRVQVDHVPGDPGEAVGQAAAPADHGDTDPAGGEGSRRPSEDAVPGADDHVTEPGSDVLVLQHVDQLEVGPVLARPHPVAGMRPAAGGLKQAKVAGGHHHLVVAAKDEAVHVPALHLADQGKTRDSSTGQVLDVHHVQRPVRKPPAGTRRTQSTDLSNPSHLRRHRHDRHLLAVSALRGIPVDNLLPSKSMRQSHGDHGYPAWTRVQSSA